MRSRGSPKSSGPGNPSLPYTTTIGNLPTGGHVGAEFYLPSEYDRLQELHQSDFELAVAKRDKAKTATEQNLAQREVERIHALMHETGFFRDPYSKFSLFAQLQLSHWQDLAHRLEPDDSLPLDSVRWLHEEVRSRRLTCQVHPTEEQAIACEVLAALTGSDSISTRPEVIETYSSSDLEWFLHQKGRLLRFLEDCIDRNEKPVCSL